MPNDERERERERERILASDEKVANWSQLNPQEVKVHYP